MKKEKLVKITAQSFILISTLSLLSVVFMAFTNPQSVMDLVQVKLNNNDAISSIRGIYGGAGLAISISLLYLMVKNTKFALSFLSMLWGFYALSRIITIFAEGTLGAFGKQWLIIETIFFIIAITLVMIYKKESIKPTI